MFSQFHECGVRIMKFKECFKKKTFYCPALIKSVEDLSISISGKGQFGYIVLVKMPVT